MTVYYKQATVNANADASFVFRLVNEVITRITFFARNPKFELSIKPILKPMSGTSALIVETDLELPMSYSYDGDLEISIKESGGVANEFALFIITGPQDVRVRAGKSW